MAFLNLFNFSLKFNGFPMEAAKTYLKKIQKENQANFSKHLEIRKKAILQHHLKHNAFYKAFTKDIKTDDWSNLPVMTKRDLQQPLQQRLSDGYTPKNVYINKTSGSSGDPFIFAKDKFCHALTWAGIFDKYAQHKIDLNASYQARFYGIPLDKKGYYKERFKDFLGNRFRFSVFDLSPTQFEKNLDKFKRSNFEYINGYTSAIVQFAKYLQSKNIILTDVCPSLKVCIVTSEMLFKDDKALLETQFNLPIINEYGAAELGLIAFENPEFNWAVNNEDLYVEILDNNNQPVKFGKPGKIVITSLFNKAHPFIRYEIGDIGILHSKSLKSAPVLKQLTGRTNDVVKLPSGKTSPGLTFYYITKEIIEDGGNVKEFIIEQSALDTFTIIYTADTELTFQQISNIKQAFNTYLEPNLKVIFERRAFLQRSHRGKLKQFRSFLPS